MKIQNPYGSQYVKLNFVADVLGWWSTIIGETDGKRRATK